MRLQSAGKDIRLEYSSGTMRQAVRSALKAILGHNLRHLIGPLKSERAATDGGLAD